MRAPGGALVRSAGCGGAAGCGGRLDVSFKVLAVRVAQGLLPLAAAVYKEREPRGCEERAESHGRVEQKPTARDVVARLRAVGI